MATLLGLLALAPAFGQPAGRQSLTFKSGNRNAKLYYFIQHKNATDKNGTLLFKNGKSIEDLQVIDFENSTTGVIEIGIDEVANMRPKDKFFIKPSCILYNSNQLERKFSGSDVIEVKDNTKTIGRSFRFRAIENGKGEIVVRIGRTNDKNDIDGIGCDHGRIVFKYQIKGLYKKIVIPEDDPPEPDPVDREKEAWDTLDKDRLRPLCNFLTDFPEGRFKETAQSKLREVSRTLWNSVDKSSNLSLQRFLDSTETSRTCVRSYRREARNLLEENRNKQQIGKEWNDFIATDPDEKGIVDFLGIAKFTVNKTKAKKLLESNHPELLVSSYDPGDSRYRIQILNPYFGPRYKNRSLNEGLEINDSRWNSEGLLEINRTKNGKFKILVRDSLGREVLIPLGSTFEVKMTESDTAYIISIVGGKRPANIRLFNHETRAEHEFEIAENQNRKVLNKTELIDQDLFGEYTVTVNYEGAPQAVELDQPIYLVKPPSNTLLWISLAAITVLAGGAWLVYILWRNKQRHQTIFDY